ncbi:MAG: sulfatase-like hydrolase/transferase [Gemmatimonadaceae bacterium]|nr:sulfatase-like hydrolase/transferase [Chitinophagaceae bacterium]
MHTAKLFLYVNSLFILLCLFEASVFLINQATNGQGLTTRKADFGDIKPMSAATTNPDIYLLIFDGYSGNHALKKEWNYDNSAIYSFLRARGFFVANHPKSNYNVTPYSIGSMLNMDYHPPFAFAKLETKDFMQGVATVSENRLCNFLTAKNYEVRNFSFFNMSYDQTRIAPFYVVNIRELIVNQTLLARFTKDRGWKNGNGALKQSVIDDEIKKENRIHYNRIGQTMSGLLNISREKREKPVFIYAHFVLPHDPYFFDSTGRAYAEKEWTVSRSDKSRYLSQLVYTNSLIKNLAESLLKDAKRERIIVIASDHGYRSFEATADPQMQFENLMAVYYPTKRYPNFYDSISSVNTFRVILKDFFNMPLPLLKDSSVYIKVW